MKKTKKLINNLIEELERTPLVQIACDKIGISRNTFYRWMKEDKTLLAQVNEAISLGTGLVNDVAVSNVLTGIKSKDPMYTKYWLDKKHPDFRRPYIFRIDSDDVLQYNRILIEKSQVQKAEIEAKELADKLDGEKLAQAIKDLEKNQAKWFMPTRTEEEKAQELFEKWKKEFLKKRGQ